MNFKMIANVPESWTVQKQFEKILEEILELKEAIALDDNKKILEEGLDVFQAILTLFKIIGIHNISEGLKEHNKKLRRRKWKLEKID
ncbi:TPA: hypothetical protein KRE09_003896 [Clostridioides difficile]|jgi:hypothetical protein|uniref:Nucleotide pyrophosphohydrolase n=6 Tax=root TaxID=1 RepID=A0A0A8WIY6_9CAUD|nr:MULTISPECIES: hypothetical protein [Bacillota]YP_009202036.1 hypothetical protein PHICD506_20048 [Clostridium phage phiCD506]YP_009213121.1 hypothetical protein PHICD48101_20046 [Clostridium phage phiCD481-1]YP_009217682.1 hypothetical protein AVU69_gp46 [Clostridium phage phiCDHM11]YP_009226617.1 hypothetical protein AXI87_gp44 [Clostridium phage phiCDHM13]QBJ05051.1 hypothetical protein JD032_6 [Clostridium phage JD032]ALP03649.1 hypothetical protein PCZ31_1719 [Clostridioides difficile]